MDSAAVHGRLTAERTHTQERLSALEAEFRALVAAGDGTNIDDEHDPEGATIAFERQQVAALVEQARTRLIDLDRALGEWQRGAEGGYGICERCGQPIAAGRLEARPDARTCIACAVDR
jgi:RNA polymerase-binding transcription factor DksA